MFYVIYAFHVVLTPLSHYETFVFIIIRLLHFIECDIMCYVALKSNIDQGRRQYIMHIVAWKF